MGKCSHQWKLAFYKMRYFNVCRKCNEMVEVEDQASVRFADIDCIIINDDDIKPENRWKLKD